MKQVQIKMILIYLLMLQFFVKIIFWYITSITISTNYKEKYLLLSAHSDTVLHLISPHGGSGKT